MAASVTGQIEGNADIVIDCQSTNGENDARFGNASRQSRNRMEHDSEMRQIQRLISLQKGTVVLTFGVLILTFVIFLTVRTQYRTTSTNTTSGESLASGIDRDTIVGPAGVSLNKSQTTDTTSNDTSFEMGVFPENSTSGLLIDYSELTPSNQPSPLSQVSLFPSKSQLRSLAPSSEPTILTSQVPSSDLTNKLYNTLLISGSPVSFGTHSNETSEDLIALNTSPTYTPTYTKATSSILIPSPSVAPGNVILSTFEPSDSDVKNTASPTYIPTYTTISSTPTVSPNTELLSTIQPSVDDLLSPFPTSQQPTESLSHQTRNITGHPTVQPTDLTMQPTNLSTCFTNYVYDSIDADIAELRHLIEDNVDQSHFLGGIVRLAAHDFMDYDRRSSRPYGPDGCFDPSHDGNNGLTESVWCENCLLRQLYDSKYNFLSRADFWISSANAVIRQTSVNNALNLKEYFTWGRIDRDSCEGSGNRLPVPSGCDQVEDTFLVRMGLEWRDAVALMGAHSLGRGHASFSGHEGIWVDNAEDAQVFDKKYFEELTLNAWRPRNANTPVQDWTTGSDDSIGLPRMMLNTDLCLIYDIERVRNQCCSRTNLLNDNGENACMSSELSRSRCPVYSRFSSRQEAVDAVKEYLGGEYPNDNNEPFYSAFTEAWLKATTLGWNDLKSMSDSCEMI